MREKDRKAKARATWIETYNALGSVSKAAIKCGIARSTLYRWLKRAKNKQNLQDYSHRPKKLAHQKINSKLEKINSLRSPKLWLRSSTDSYLSSARAWYSPIFVNHMATSKKGSSKAIETLSLPS